MTTITKNRLAALLLLCATSVTAFARGDNEGFSAGLSVQPRASAADIGLPLYPGAVPERDRDGAGDGEGASISLWGGPFGMDLHVMKLRSADTPDAVSRYYRDAMQRQGRLVDCGRDAPADPPVGTATDGGKLMRCGNDRAKAGAYLFKLALPGGVRMVAIEPAPGGSRIQLVRLLLRGD